MKQEQIEKIAQSNYEHIASLPVGKLIEEATNNLTALMAIKDMESYSKKPNQAVIHLANARIIATLGLQHKLSHRTRNQTVQSGNAGSNLFAQLCVDTCFQSSKNPC